MCGAIWRGVVYYIYLVTSYWFGTYRASLGESMDPSLGGCIDSGDSVNIHVLVCFCLCRHIYLCA